MKKVALITLLVTLIIGCESSSTNNSANDPDIVSPPVPENDVELDANVHFCDHKYSDDRDFHYEGQVRSFTQQLFGENVTTFTFTLLDGTEKFLSDNELANYSCE